MPIRKLKPIEERDPYAAAVLKAFDEFAEKFPPIGSIPKNEKELSAELRCVELAKRIQAEIDEKVGLSTLEWLLHDCEANVFWHAGANVFVVGEWRFQAPTLAEAIAIASKGFKEKQT